MGRDVFLAQNGFSPYDKYCPLYKTAWMLRNLVEFETLAQKAVESTAASDKKITWKLISDTMNETILRALVAMKFKDPIADGKVKICNEMAKLRDDMKDEFRKLEEAL